MVLRNLLFYSSQTVLIRDRIEGGDLGLCIFFEVFFYTIFWHYFEKLTPENPVFWTIHEGYPENFFMNPNFFPKLSFIAFFGHFFSKNCQNFLKRRLRRQFRAEIGAKRVFFRRLRRRKCVFFLSRSPPLAPVTPPLFDPWF